MDFKVGDILHDSWGYNMTINDYCKIVEVSKTGKTVKCRMVRKFVEVDMSPSEGTSESGKEEYGDEFRLHVIKSHSGLYFVDKYPFCEGSKRSGSFTKWNGKPNYYNTWD